MSDNSQGPGWWQASDGKWYPPQNQAAPPPPPGNYSASPATYNTPPPYSVPGAQPGYGVPPKKEGMPGWLKALLIIGGILAVLVAGCTVAVGVFANKVQNDITKGCSFLSSDAATTAYGTKVATLPLQGITSLANAALDTRVLNKAPSCMVTPADQTAKIGLSRIARLESSDAAAVFAKELKNAKGVSTDDGSGTTLSTDSYLSDEEVTLGDEAFCTTSSLPPSAGVLVRQGNVLLYVSIAPTSAQSQDVSNTGLSELEATECALAQKVVKAILNI